MLSTRTILISGAVSAGLAVGLGAFGAHALKAMLTEHHNTDTWKLAAQYHFYHSMALLAIGLLMDRAVNKKLFGWAGLCMLAGIFLFSGSLYALALDGRRGIALLTPLGGLFFLAGWSLLAVAVARK